MKCAVCSVQCILRSEPGAAMNIIVQHTKYRDHKVYFNFHNFEMAYQEAVNNASASPNSFSALALDSHQSSSSE